jgi:hypothetical protein
LESGIGQCFGELIGRWVIAHGQFRTLIADSSIADNGRPSNLTEVVAQQVSGVKVWWGKGIGLVNSNRLLWTGEKFFPRRPPILRPHPAAVGAG